MNSPDQNSPNEAESSVLWARNDWHNLTAMTLARMLVAWPPRSVVRTASADSHPFEVHRLSWVQGGCELLVSERPLTFGLDLGGDAATVHMSRRDGALLAAWGLGFIAPGHSVGAQSELDRPVTRAECGVIEGLLTRWMRSLSLPAVVSCRDAETFAKSASAPHAVGGFDFALRIPGQDAALSIFMHCTSGFVARLALFTCPENLSNFSVPATLVLAETTLAAEDWDNARAGDVVVFDGIAAPGVGASLPVQLCLGRLDWPGLLGADGGLTMATMPCGLPCGLPGATEALLAGQETTRRTSAPAPKPSPSVLLGAWLPLEALDGVQIEALALGHRLPLGRGVWHHFGLGIRGESPRAADLVAVEDQIAFRLR